MEKDGTIFIKYTSDEKWFIKYDRYSYQLNETRPLTDRETGEVKGTRDKVHGYFGTIGLALVKYAELQLEDAKTIYEWLERYDEITKELKKL